MSQIHTNTGLQKGEIIYYTYANCLTTTTQWIYSLSMNRNALRGICKCICLHVLVWYTTADASVKINKNTCMFVCVPCVGLRNMWKNDNRRTNCLNKAPSGCHFAYIPIKFFKIVNCQWNEMIYIEMLLFNVLLYFLGFFTITFCSFSSFYERINVSRERFACQFKCEYSASKFGNLWNIFFIYSYYTELMLQIWVNLEKG